MAMGQGICGVRLYVDPWLRKSAGSQRKVGPWPGHSFLPLVLVLVSVYALGTGGFLRTSQISVCFHLFILF